MSKKSRKPQGPRRDPFIPGVLPPAYQRGGFTAVWLNSTYQVWVQPLGVPHGFPAEATMVHLSIKRRDKAVLREWRDLQAIKNALVGPECEGVELYPSESRLMDESTQYHLYCFTNPDIKFPFGEFQPRSVLKSVDVKWMGARQNDYEPPDMTPLPPQLVEVG